MQVGKLTVEVNWEPSVIPCKKIKVTFDGKVQLIKYEDFFTMMFLFGGDKEQDKLMASKKVLMRVVERMISIRAGRDMKKDEVMKFKYKYAIPDEEYKRLKELHPNSVKLADEKKNVV